MPTKAIPNKLLWLCLAALLTGCSASEAIEDQTVADHRTRLLLAEEPAGAVSVLDAKAAASSQEEIVIIGRIAAGEHTPWDHGKAAFLVSDAAANLDDHGHGACHDDNCLFCKDASSVTDKLAIVRFLDRQGQVLPIDARKLLGVEENQLVVVRGRGEVDPLGNLVIAAEGIYIRR